MPVSYVLMGVLAFAAGLFFLARISGDWKQAILGVIIVIAIIIDLVRKRELFRRE